MPPRCRLRRSSRANGARDCEYARISSTIPQGFSRGGRDAMKPKGSGKCFGIGFLLASTLVAACDDSVTTLQPEKLAPPLGLQSVTGSGAVTLSWQASNYGEDRQGFQVYQATGTQPATPSESVPSEFGTTPVATLTTIQEAGTFTQTVT